MLPDWDFAGDETKRRAFIEWVWTELDRFAVMASERDPVPTDRDDWTQLFQPGLVKSAAGAGRPADEFAGMNAMVWEFGLLRYMYNRYWPGRKRRITDPASAASIAVARCRAALAREHRTADRLAITRERMHDDARKVADEWERGTRTPGRLQAQADIAFLDTLPINRFAR